MQAHLRFIASSTAQIRLWPMAWRRFLFSRSPSRPLRARSALDSKPTVSLNCRAARQVFWRRFLCSSAVSSAAAQRPWWSLPSGRPAIRSGLFRFWLAISISISISRSQRSSLHQTSKRPPRAGLHLQSANSTSTPPHRSLKPQFGQLLSRSP
jgi:hypothetical protein